MGVRTPTGLATHRLDGSPERVAELATALAGALDGAGPVLPLGPAATIDVPTDEPGPGTAVVIATSGSTGEPKLVVLSAAALRASALATAERLDGPAQWLLALPAEHVAGVQVVVRALLAGTSPVVQDLRGGFRPDDFARATTGSVPGAGAPASSPLSSAGSSTPAMARSTPCAATTRCWSEGPRWTRPCTRGPGRRRCQWSRPTA